MQITSPNTFKTCYIADVKEEMGLLTRTSINRRGKERKHKAPEKYKDYIVKAINELSKSGIKITYKNIQLKAFEIYQKENNKIDKYYGTIKPSKQLSENDLKKIIDNEDFLYED